MTNCGAFGWVTDRSGYRYDPIDPESGQRWPKMPAAFSDLAARAAEAAGLAVWGGPARMTFHGVHPIEDSSHPLTGNVRYNLMLRRAK